MSSARPRWVLSGAAIDLDFANSSYYGAGGLLGNLSCSAASTRYRQTSTGLWVPIASNVLPITDLGLSPWESRTNSLRNNTMQGASTSPSTLPTNWAVENSNGVTTTVVGLGTEDGVDYIDLRFTGTPTNTFYQLRFESVVQIVAAQNQTWAGSFFGKKVGGTTTNISGATPLIKSLTSAGSGISQATPGSVNLASVASLGNNRVGGTYTLPDATAGRVDLYLSLIFGSTGVAIDITLRIGWPQLELGAFVSPPKPTSGTASTDAADIIQLTGLASALMTNNAALSLYFETSGLPGVGSNNLYEFGGAGGGNRASYTSGTNLFITNGSNTINETAGSGTTAGLMKTIVTGDDNQFYGKANGGAFTVNNAPFSWSKVTPLYLGGNSAGTRQLNGTLRRFAARNAKGAWDALAA